MLKAQEKIKEFNDLYQSNSYETATVTQRCHDVTK